ncbi:uncharacterized protein DUF2577 [Fontibacillus phaseoli]|uniref:Uncharacterized protein DUF2577 n=1 Tax=Fontibacillus phaseoli TaxID=1416533 RepID=A0A369BPR1_9BACL|nr:DUF2577 domain-containing protein [Fontibacillus phaseoli]RCX22596.1 uncharacterized protein DUF2577 [Fontibacillus phaseoli]
MMALGDKIRKLGSEAVGAGNPVAVLFGTVTRAHPLEVNVDQRFTFDEDFLILTESLQRYELDLKHTHLLPGSEATKEALTDKIVIRAGLQKGDVVLLLRVQGGQKYVVWDKVVKP